MMKFVYNIEMKYPLALPSMYTTLSSIFFALNSFSVKYFDGIPATQIMYWRSILTLIIIEILALFIPNNTYPPSSQTMKKLISRGLIGGVGFLSCFLSLKLVTVSEAVVLMKTNPLWTTFILAYILKKEIITKRTILEILFCLLGVILISKPPILFNQNDTEFTYLNFFGLCLAIVTAVSTSFVQVLINSLSQEVSSLAILQYFSFFGIISSILCQLCYSLEEFKAVSFYEANLLLFSGFLGCLGQLCMNRSVMIGNVTQQSIIGESQIIFNILLDIFVLKQDIEIFSWIGMTIIIISLTSNLLRKQ